MERTWNLQLGWESTLSICQATREGERKKRRLSLPGTHCRARARNGNVKGGEAGSFAGYVHESLQIIIAGRGREHDRNGLGRRTGTADGSRGQPTPADVHRGPAHNSWRQDPETVDGRD